MPNNNKGIFNVFFREKPAMMLVELNRAMKQKKENVKGEIGEIRGEVYASSIAKIVDCTYSHAVKILQSLERLGLVGFEKKGRIKLIKLTKKGQEIAENIDNIKKLIS